MLTLLLSPSSPEVKNKPKQNIISNVIKAPVSMKQYLSQSDFRVSEELEFVKIREGTEGEVAGRKPIWTVLQVQGLNLSRVKMQEEDSCSIMKAFLQ